MPTFSRMMGTGDVRFEFATASRILFGPGACAEIPQAARAFGRRALVVGSLERSAPLREGLRAAGVEALLYPITGEPTVVVVLEGLRIAREGGCDLVIGIGGGSALDTGKAIAALLTNPGDIYDYLEVIGKGKSFQEPSAPCIAIPTTAGTGTEVTRNAVIVAPEQQVKVSLRSPFLLPKLAVVDPELTYSLPPSVTAATGLDALTQLIEPFVSNAANPMTDAVCREGMRRAARSLLRAYQDGKDKDARQDMSLASLFSGMALANARLGAAHGFASVIGGMFPAPHGAVCARLLPFVMEANMRALKARQPSAPTLARYAEIAQILTGDVQAKTEAGIEWVQQLLDEMNIPPLSAYGLTADAYPVIVAEAKKSSSMKGNPVALTEQELVGILEKACLRHHWLCLPTFPDTSSRPIPS
ncbi:MAG: iron-containing alcohol dehydrogenase [Anaerolineales bacterium]|nr:iron-containing alcohol dehydrogenase [Anaerolineales bacterium]